jgi:hypothetical protein
VLKWFDVRQFRHPNKTRDTQTGKFIIYRMTINGTRLG